MSIGLLGRQPRNPPYTRFWERDYWQKNSRMPNGAVVGLFFKSLITLCLLPLFFILNGCSDHKNNGQLALSIEQDSNLSQKHTGIKVFGTVMKGAISSADCQAISATGKVLYSSERNTEPCTNKRGRFAFNITDIPAEPVILNIKARTDSRMICDHPAGCGETRFGNTVMLTTGLVIRAAVDRIDPQATTMELNVTPWSDMALARALVLANNDVTPLTKDHIRTAHESVASVLNAVLGLQGSSQAFHRNFTTIDPVNIAATKPETDIDTTDAFNGTLLSIASASLLELMSHSSFNSVEQVIRLVSTDFEDGELNVNGDAAGIDPLEVVSVASIASKIASVAQGLKRKVPPAQRASIAQSLQKRSFDQAMDELSEKLTKLSLALSSVTDQAHFSIGSGRASQ